MTLKIMNFISEQETPEKLMGVFLLNENGDEISKLTFYVKDEHSRIEPELIKSLEKLPLFFKDIYNLGKSGAALDFSSEDIKISSEN